MSLAQYIDHTILKPETKASDIQVVCTEAIQHGFAAVCIPPYFIPQAKKQLDATDIKVATVIGFPFGYSHCTAKVSEVADAIAHGADELDLVINFTALLQGDTDTLEKEIAAVTEANAGRAVLKLILETGLLTEAQIITCCQLYQRFPVAFLKTSTGYAAQGASVAAVQTMRANLPAHIQVKASGGIRDHVFAAELIDAGATRLGCSASVAIVNGASAGQGNY